MFLTPLDDARQWYRYHTLFAEAMQHIARRRLGEACLRSLSDKASHWYEQHGFLVEAIEITLAAQTFTRAAVLIERLTKLPGFHNELHTLRRWLEQLPKEVLAGHPELCLHYAQVLLYTSDRCAPETAALLQMPREMAEQHWQDEDNRPRLGEVLTFRASVAWWQGNLALMATLANQALDWLPEQETLCRGTNLLFIGVAELLAGRLDTASQIISKAHMHCEAARNSYGIRAALISQGRIYLEQGKLHLAAQIYHQIYTEAKEDFSDTGHALIGLALLSLERNELETAEQCASQVLEIGRQHTNDTNRQQIEKELLIPGSLVLARILHARGKTAQALQLLYPLATLTEQRRWPLLHREVRTCQAWLSLAGGDLATVQQWYTTYAQHSNDIPRIQQEQEALLAARMLIAQGATVAALRLLERWQTEAQAQGRRRSLLKIQILTALAHFTHKDLL